MNVTRQEALDFLDIATRNWPEMLPLSEDDIGDVASALLAFAITCAKRQWQDMSSAPKEATFLAETKAGDWLQVERYDNPHGFKDTVIDNRTGRWWTPARWMPLPPASKSIGDNHG